MLGFACLFLPMSGRWSISYKSYEYFFLSSLSPIKSDIRKNLISPERLFSYQLYYSPSKVLFSYYFMWMINISSQTPGIVKLYISIAHSY